METKDEARKRVQKLEGRLEKYKCSYCNSKGSFKISMIGFHLFCSNCGSILLDKGINMKRWAVIAIGITIAACILILATGCGGAPVTKTEAKLHLTQLNKFGEGLIQLLDDPDLRESEPAREAIKLEYQTLQESGEKLAKEAEDDNTE